MPGYKKRKRVGSTPKYLKRPTKKARKTRFAGKAGIQRVVSKMLKSKIETKQSVRSYAATTEIAHNNFISLEAGNTFFATTNGTGDPMTGTGNRIGDEITLKGVAFKMMVELNVRYSDVTFKLILVRSSKGDVPTRASLFRGLSGNKMLDNFNTERYSIMYTKTFQIKAANQGTAGPDAGITISSVFQPGGFNQAVGDVTQSRATKIVKFYIPGTKFAKNGVIKYEDLSTTQVKFYDYHLVLYAYANQTCAQDLFNVGRLNDYIKIMYYTDA